jgi:3-deoxy-D-manno-octulosonic acid (KDO) 8-phosphate synthase
MFDDMRSVQVTGGYMLYIESSSGENSKFALPLSKPAIAVEIATLF